MQKEWLKETARDLIALASLPFYIIAVVRITIAEHKIYTWQLSIALITIYLFYFILKRSANLYAAMSIPLLIFTNIFYNNIRYLIFSGMLVLLLFLSLVYLGYKKKGIIFGAGIGIFAAIAGYALAH